MHEPATTVTKEAKPVASRTYGPVTVRRPRPHIRGVAAEGRRGLGHGSAGLSLLFADAFKGTIRLVYGKCCA